MTVDPNHLLRLLNDIETALVHLAATPAVREIGSQVRSGGRPGSMPPGDLRVLDLLDERSRDAIVPKLLSWAVMIREERQDAGLDDDGPDDAILTAVCRYLRSRAGYVASQAWADEMLAEVTSIRRTLVAMPGSPLFREVIQRTPCIEQVHDVAGGRNCVGTIETKITEVRTKVEVRSVCDSCGRIYTEAAMTLAVLTQEAAVLHVTVPEAVQRLRGRTPPLEVTESNIYNWVHRGAVEQLRNHDDVRLTREGKPLYDLAVIRSFAERAQRTRLRRVASAELQAGDTVRDVGGEVTPADVSVG